MTLTLLGFAVIAFVALEVGPDAGGGSGVPGPAGGGVVELAGEDTGVVPDDDGIGRRTASALRAVAGRLGGGRAPEARAATRAVASDGWPDTRIGDWEPRRHAAPMAAVGDLEVFSPVVDPVVVGFHEASTTIGFGMRPLGTLAGNDNTTRYTPADDVRDDALPYVVLASRGRAAGPTTAVDVVARPEEPVVAPVTGIVTDIRSYALYGRHPDQRVEIRPRKNPSLRVVLVHVTDVEVAVGDQVIGGVSVIAGSATVFPFASQIDRKTEPDRFPHVHIEVQPFDARRPGDP